MESKYTRFSVVVPVLNEEENITPLLHELSAVMQDKQEVEVIYVDDHSTDRTPEILTRHSAEFPWLRVIRLRRQSGQSAALRCGVQHAAYPLVVTLDGDGQNDPADIQQLIDIYRRESHEITLCLVNGHRVTRKDSGWRRWTSFIANTVRSHVLSDDTPDSGCGIKAFPRDGFLQLPSFSHMHRFVPALIRQRGGKVVSVAVHHRGRSSGKSHYGTWDRLAAGIIDLIGVYWLGRRAIRTDTAMEKKHHEGQKT